MNAFAPQIFDTRPKRLPLDSKEGSPTFKKCDGNAFSLSQRRVHMMMKSVESIDRAVMLLKALPNLCYSDNFYRTHKTHHSGNHRMMGTTSSQQVMITIRGRLYIYAHHSLPLSLLFSFYLILDCIEHLNIFHWKISILISGQLSEEGLMQYLAEISLSLHPFSPFHLHIPF